MARARKLETFSDYQRSLEKKYGLGTGVDYKPWLRVQDVSSLGSSSKIRGYKIPRIFHTLSKYESYFFHLAEFSNSVIDIREQFPLLPIDLSIRYANLLGVKHPTNPTSNIDLPPVLDTTIS